MNDIVNWIITIEEMAAKLYADAAIQFSSDLSFSEFLSKMAQEERQHELLLKEALTCIPPGKMKENSFYFDNDFCQRIEAPFRHAQSLLEKDALTQAIMIETIVEAEFSEWNEIFLYTVDTLRVTNDKFIKAVTDIDHHRMNVQDYISRLPENEHFIQKIRRLAKGQGVRVLIIEENLAIARMLEALITTEAEVIIARDGEDGISHIRQRKFDLIIADPEVPKLNGIEIYKQALVVDSSLRHCFIMFTGTDNQDLINFIKEAQITTISKPSPVKEIYHSITKIIEESPRKRPSTCH